MSKYQLLRLISIIFALIFIAGFTLHQNQFANADGELTVTIMAGPNLVVDSNVLSPSTQAPSVATVLGRFCNTTGSVLEDVTANIGTYTGSGTGSPGMYPVRDSSTIDFQASHPLLADSGLYSFTHMGGNIGLEDASRYIGSIPAHECRVQYWHFTYPRTNPAYTQPVWGLSNTPVDDLWLTFDVWGTAAGSVYANASFKMTMRNEISAMANKIKPNPDGQWFNTGSDIVEPGDTITSNGIDYELGVINQGFDNDVPPDYVPDFNAWLQPVGNPSYDPSCFRLIQTSGTVTITRGGGNPDTIYNFTDQLYFTHLPDDNTGGKGRVYYTFLALGGPCSASLSPYQEVASGRDNEKFNGDYGTGVPAVGSTAPAVTIDKTGNETVSPGNQITYNIPFVNTGTANAGLPLFNMPLVISDTIPMGTTFVSASYSWSVTDGITIYYSTDNGLTWSTTASTPSAVTTVQWRFNQQLPKAGLPNNSGSVSMTVQVPASSPPNQPIITNTACSSFGDGVAFDCGTAITLVLGDNSIGDRVWLDNNNNGIDDASIPEEGASNVTLKLYWDQGTIGTLDTDDVILLTTTTGSGGSAGAYSFPSLPDAYFLVEVDPTTAPDGYAPTTPQVIGVDLDHAGGNPVAVNNTTTDFGLGPSLVIDKRLLSSNPVDEGGTVTYQIDVTNRLPGDGTSDGYCKYTVWSTIDHPDQNYTPPGGNNSVSRWDNTVNALNSPNGTYAEGNVSSNRNKVGYSGYIQGAQTGSITDVTVSLYFREVVNIPMGDAIEIYLWYQDTQVTNAIGVFNRTVDDFPDTVGSTYVKTISMNQRPTNTTPVAWQWSDFTQYGTPIQDSLTELQLVNVGNGGGRIGLDAIAMVITTDQQTCGNSNTMDPVPLTDTYNDSYLQFITANPMQSSHTVNGASSVLSWNNLGPLYGGQTKSVMVTFRARDPMDISFTTQNTASILDARFVNGRPVNDAVDSASVTIQGRGSITGNVWSEVTGGTTGWSGLDGFDSGDTFIPNLSVSLSACVIKASGVLITPSTPGYDPLKTCVDQTGNNKGEWRLMSSTMTDSAGKYIFEGLYDGFYYTQVAPLVGTTQSAEPRQNGTGVSCSPTPSPACSNVWNASVNTGLSAPLNSTNFNNILGNEDITRINFGYDNVPARVYGLVFQDIDRDGIRTVATEPGIQNVWAYLCRDDRPTCDSSSYDDRQQTALDGSYTFTGVPTGFNYQVYIDTSSLPSGLETQTADPDSTLDNCTTTAFLVTGGSVKGSYDFGYAGSGQIGDEIYRDWDGSGIRDVLSEEGLDGVVVFLYRDMNGNGSYDSSNDLFISQTTTSAGAYLFDRLVAGTYFVLVSHASLPSQHLQTADPSYPNVPCVGAQCDNMGTISLTAGGSDLSQDFGYKPSGLGSIGDLVWNDTNANGIQDTGESGINAVVVMLYQDQDGDGILDAEDAFVAQTTTSGVAAEAGSYAFENAPAGNYIIRIDPANFDEGQPLCSLTLSNTSSPYHQGQVSYKIALETNQAFTEADFGFTSSSIGDFVWQDDNGDGLQEYGEPGIANVVIHLYRDRNDDGDVADVVGGVDESIAIATTLTSSDPLTLGRYYFTGLLAGEYFVALADSNFSTGGPLDTALFTQTYDPDAPHVPCMAGECDSWSVISDQSVNPITGNPVTGLPLGQDDHSNDFGFRPNGVLGDFVWLDSDGDGVQDVGEFGIANVTVTLDDCGDDSVCGNGDDGLTDSTTTNSDGYYTFGSLLNRTYRVRVDATTLPDGLTTPTFDRDGGLDDQADVAIVNGGTYLDVDFGYRYGGLYHITGTVFFDTDNTPGELYILGEDIPYEGITVYLSKGNVLIATTTTDVNGLYDYGSLPNASDYAVSVDRNSQQIFGLDLNTPVLNAYYQPVVINEADSNGNDFGFYAAIDFGDLPSNYRLTYVSDGGPRHRIGTLILGTEISAEANGTEDADARGDAGDNGVGPTSGIPWMVGANGGHIDITVNGGSGYVSGWIDWNADGDFNDTWERVMLDQPVSGTQSFLINVPGAPGIDPLPTTIFVRFRLYAASTGGTASPSGYAVDGEVEDQKWQFLPTSVTLANLSASSGFTRIPLGDVAVVGLLGLVSLTWCLIKRKS